MSGSGTVPPLTARQREVLAFVKTHVREHGLPPTNAEIAAGCALGAPSGAHRIITVLEGRGYLERRSGRSRGLRLAEPAATLGALTPNAAGVLAAVCVFQRAVRDRLLRTAVEPGLPAAVVRELLRDATARNDLVLAFDGAAAAAQSGAQQADVLTELLGPIRERSRWSELVVDLAIFNEGSIAGAERMLERSPELEPALLEVIEVSRSSLERCRRWLADLVASTRDRGDLQRRAAYVEQVMRLSAAVMDQQLADDAALSVLWDEDPIGRIVGQDGPASRTRRSPSKAR